MSTLNELGLAPMQSMALMQLAPGEPMTMSALAHALMCDNSNVTGIADRLEALGLVERRPPSTTAASRRSCITEQGIALRGEVERRMSVPPPPLAGLSDEDAAALRDILAARARRLRAGARPARRTSPTAGSAAPRASARGCAPTSRRCARR